MRPGTSQMWIVEHGPDFDDEINLLTAGGNYGWDPVPGYDESVPMTDLTKFPTAIEARWSSGVSTLAASGGIFLSGVDWGKWNGWLAVASLKDQTLRFFHFASDGTFIEQVNVPEMNGIYGRLRTPMLGPDGSLYVTTSNGGNDKILKITPAGDNDGGEGGGGEGGGGGGGGEGGGGNGARPTDDHGNTAGSATRIQPSGRTAGQLHTRSDVDYFTLTAPQAGVLVVETTGRTDTRATVWQDGVEVARADSGGRGQNFRLGARVEAGSVVIAVRGNGRQTGSYTLRTTLVAYHVENPPPRSFQSGLGVISGWVCEAEGVAVEIEKENGEVVELATAYGTERADTAESCGDTDNGFGVLFNWNLLGDGEHAVSVLIDGIELGRATVTVTTLGEEFVEGLQRSFLVADFPRPGEQVQGVWQESQQNFVLAPAELGAASAPTQGPRAIEGVLENPAPASYQSGIGVISGWVCEADEVVIEIDGQPIAAATGTERADTLDRCGDVANGFGLLVNWAEFGAGEHEVVALVDGVELSRATVVVTVVDETEPYVRGLAKRVEVEDFPQPGETVTLEWQQSQQNFVITGVR